jgi:hypothetical protein
LPLKKAAARLPHPKALFAARLQRLLHDSPDSLRARILAGTNASLSGGDTKQFDCQIHN